MSHHLHEFWKAKAFWKAKTTILKTHSVAMCQKCHQNNENHRRKTVNIGNAALAPQTDQEIRIFPIISGGMSHTMFPVIFVSILLYNLQKCSSLLFNKYRCRTHTELRANFSKIFLGEIRGRMVAVTHTIVCSPDNIPYLADK